MASDSWPKIENCRWPCAFHRLAENPSGEQGADLLSLQVVEEEGLGAGGHRALPGGPQPALAFGQHRDVAVALGALGGEEERAQLA